MQRLEFEGELVLLLVGRCVAMQYLLEDGRQVFRKLWRSKMVAEMEGVVENHRRGVVLKKLVDWLTTRLGIDW